MREVTIVFLTDIELDDSEWERTLESLTADINVLEVTQEEA